MLGFSHNLLAQAGMTVSPGKLYFKLAPGGAGTQKIVVSNPNKMVHFRAIMTKEEVLDNVSALEKEEQQGDDYNDFKEAISG